MTNQASSDLPYRRCVGIMLLNRDGLAFVGRRIGPAGNEHVARGFDWQMPQGGIDEGETPEESARRELAEETGVRQACLLREAPDWLSYDIPPALIGRRWVGKYRGQTQKWFAYRFEGDEAEIDIAAPQGHAPEFDAWRWVAISELPDLVIPFKREVYRAVVEVFADLAA